MERKLVHTKVEKKMKIQYEITTINIKQNTKQKEGVLLVLTDRRDLSWIP